jgi:valyl-tRNA synthetase
MQIEKIYEPQRFEPHWAQWWIEAGIYRANPDAPGPRCSIVIPPPNVTGCAKSHDVASTAEGFDRRYYRS